MGSNGKRKWKKRLDNNCCGGQPGLVEMNVGGEKRKGQKVDH